MTKKILLSLISLFWLSAFTQTGGQLNLGGDPSQPSLASSNGFNTNVFYENFCNIGDIDINNTHAPGFHLYNQIVNYSGSPDPIFEPPSSYSVSNCVLTFTPTQPQNGSILTPGYIGPGSVPQQRIAGAVIAPTGGYMGARIAFDPTLSPGSSGTAWPSFWFQSQDLMLWDQDGLRNSFPYHACEVDIMEFYIGSSSPGTGTPRENVIDFNTSGGNTVSTSNPPIPDANFHLYEVIWQIPEKNGGTGFVKWYYDSTLEKTVTYTNPGTYSCLDYLDVNGPPHPTGFVVLMSSAPNWPLKVEYLSVWQ